MNMEIVLFKSVYLTLCEGLVKYEGLCIISRIGNHGRSTISLGNSQSLTEIQMHNALQLTEHKYQQRNL